MLTVKLMKYGKAISDRARCMTEKQFRVGHCSKCGRPHNADTNDNWWCPQCLDEAKQQPGCPDRAMEFGFSGGKMTPLVTCICPTMPSGRFSTKIVEAEEVDIHVLRPGELVEVAARCGDRTYAFYVADQHKPRPDGFADEVDFWFSAFIENSSGATTEVVRF